MGISESWISVAGMSRGEFLDRLELAETGYTHDHNEGGFARYETHGGVATLPNGRHLYISRTPDLATPEVAARVSKGAQLIMGSVVETVMVSEAWSFTDGRMDWMILHDRESRGRHDAPEIEAKGLLPESFNRSLVEAERLSREHPGVDYHISVPYDVAEPIGGWRPDEIPEGFDGIFVLLEPKVDADRRREKEARRAERKAKGGFLGRLFGGS